MREPGGVLSEIVRAKQAELASRYEGASLDALRSQAEPARRSLAKTVAQYLVIPSSDWPRQIRCRGRSGLRGERSTSQRR